MPIKKDIKQPEELLSWTDMLDQYGDFLPNKMKAFLSIERPIEFKPTEIVNPLDQKDLPPIVDVWFKLKGEATDLELGLKQQILTYISDYNILTACLYPNASKANFGNTQMASLDHSMWFYRDFDFNDWMLFSIESPSTFGARGFACGNIYTRDGILIASVAQEGLMRPHKKK
ncbi:MAG: acyl-CoA thioesterase, partial [Flavobacteriaceae bacterium]